jgi:hypothetical protein
MILTYIFFVWHFKLRNFNHGVNISWFFSSLSRNLSLNSNSVNLKYESLKLKVEKYVKFQIKPRTLKFLKLKFELWTLKLEENTWISEAVWRRQRMRKKTSSTSFCAAKIRNGKNLKLGNLIKSKLTKKLWCWIF